MAANTTKTQTKTSQPIDWKAEIGIDYATYANEKTYVSPHVVGEECIERLSALRQKLEAAFAGHPKPTVKAAHRHIKSLGLPAQPKTRTHMKSI